MLFVSNTKHSVFFKLIKYEQPHRLHGKQSRRRFVGVLQFIDPAIAACNVFGNFLIPEYYAATGIPVGKEIDQLIDIVYHGEEQTFETEEQPF